MGGAFYESCCDPSERPSVPSQGHSVHQTGGTMYAELMWIRLGFAQQPDDHFGIYRLHHVR